MICIDTDRSPTYLTWRDEVVCQLSAALLRTAGVPDFNINHKPQFNFPAFALPQSRSYQLQNRRKEENPAGVIYVVNQK